MRHVMWVLSFGLCAFPASAQSTGIAGTNDLTVNGAGSGSTSCTSIAAAGTPLTFVVSTAASAPVALLGAACPCSPGLASFANPCFAPNDLDIPYGFGCPGVFMAGVSDGGGVFRVTFPPCLTPTAFSAQAVILLPGCGLTFTQAYDVRCSARPVEIFVEDFADESRMDREYSSGEWRDGSAFPGALGGDGRHGEFDITLGVETPPGSQVYEWDLDTLVIPRTHTRSGQDEPVVDGELFFSRFVLPAGHTVRFRGQHSVRIFVRGLAQIDGTIDVSGESLPAPDGNAPVGQAGGRGGPGGGDGGKGGDPGDGTRNLLFDGAPGAVPLIPVGHAQATALSLSAGSASGQFPHSDPMVTYTGFSGFVCSQICAGGGGAGGAEYRAPIVAAQTGLVTVNTTEADKGPPAVGGGMVDLYAHCRAQASSPPCLAPNPTGLSTLDHFLIGGAGGGGTGSHAYLTPRPIPFPPPVGEWKAGGGGAGGAGAVGLRIGRSLGMGAASAILAHGGSTSDSSQPENDYSVPGGGAAGGSILIQVDGPAAMGGTLDVSGGVGGTVGVVGLITTTVKAGDGSHGFIRLDVDAPNPPLSALGQTVPDPVADPGITSMGVFTLQDRDHVTGARSLWEALPTITLPEFVHYELEATVDGQPVAFSDAPSRGLPLAAGSQPVHLFVQGAALGPGGQVDPSTRTPWFRYVGPFAPQGEGSLAGSGAQAVRYLLIFNRSTPAQAIKVDKLTIAYQPF